MEEINIVFATDEGYAMQTYISMQSIMECGKHSDKYVFWIMCNKSQDIDLMRYFTELQENYTNCIINYLDVGDCFENVPLPTAHITKPTYYRLLLPVLLNVEKCIYLDSDIIVCNDLGTLYSISIEEYELAGVLACAYHKDTGSQNKYMQEINIPAMDTYINAGVLIMNLKKMRESDFSKSAISMAEKKYPASDQDILNILSYGKIKKLPVTYNYQAGYVDDKRVNFEKIYGREDAANARKNPTIIHYLTPQKPWEFHNVKYAEKWWDVCQRTPYFTCFFNCYRKSFYYFGMITRQRFWQTQQGSDLWYNMLKQFNAIHLYGAGQYAKKIISKFQSRGIQIKSIYVSNSKNNPSELEGIKVEQFIGQEKMGDIVLVGASASVAVLIYRELLEKDVYHFCILDCDSILD